MISIKDFVKISKMSRSTIDNRIKKLGVKKIKIVQGRGGSVAYISDGDAQMITNYVKPGKWEHYIKSTEIAEELGITTRNVTIMAEEFGVKGVKVRRSHTESACICYSPNQYEILTGRVIVPEELKTGSKFASKSGCNAENRKKGLYHKLTNDAGMIPA